MSDWHFDCCMLNEDKWPRIGCDIPKYEPGGMARVELSTPFFYLSAAFRSKDKFVRIKDYYKGMPPTEYVYETHWVHFRRRKRD